MALTGTHAADDTGHVADHNLIDALLASHTSSLATLDSGKLATTAGALIGAVNRDLRVVAGVIRNDGSPNYWQPIDDSGHAPVNVDSVSTSTTAITVDYTSVAAAKVVTFVVGADDTLAVRGYVAGSSVGLTSAVITLTMTKAYADYVYYDGAAWQTTSGVFTPTFSAGVLTCTHPAIPAANVLDTQVTGRGTLIPSSHGVSSTAAIVRFHDYSGTLQTTASTDMKAFVRHGSNGIADPQQVDTTLYPGSNLWFIGVFEV